MKDQELKLFCEREKKKNSSFSKKILLIFTRILPSIYRRVVRRKTNLEEPDEEKPVSSKKAKNVHILWLFSREAGFSSFELRNWIFFVPRNDIENVLSIWIIEY